MKTQAPPILVEADVKVTIEKVWDLWTSPTHITQWNTASPHWHTRGPKII